MASGGGAAALLARIRAILRRHHLSLQRRLSAGELQLDRETREVWRAGRPIELTPREFDLLYTLAMEAGHVVSVDELLGRVWGAEFVGEPQVVYVHIRWLREKLEDDPNHHRRIVTVRGEGYKLELQEA